MISEMQELKMSQEGYKITQAEFKGRVLQSLEDIRSDVGDLKKGMIYTNTEITTIKIELAKKACKSDITDIQKQISGIKIVSSTLGAIAGLLTGIGSLFIRRGQ